MIAVAADSVELVELLYSDELPTDEPVIVGANVGAAEALRAAGYVATCAPEGVSWDRVDIGPLVGAAEVLIFGEPEWSGAELEESLAALGVQVRLFDLGTGGVAGVLADEGDNVTPPSSTPTATATATADVLPGVLGGLDARLPDEFWESRTALQLIRQAARARLVPPDAVLGGVLARVAALTDHTVELPAVVGSPCGLSYLAAIVGPPEAGKSASAAVAAELVPAPAGVLDRVPIGSGEGLVEALFDTVEVKGDDGKVRRERKQTRHQLILHVDEGAVLHDLGSRAGSTTLSTLRTAWTHGPLGQLNARAETKRVVDGRSYVVSATIGLQPGVSQALLDDAVAGTPQRLVWFSAVDHDAPDTPPDWPEFAWAPLDVTTMPAVIRGGWRRHPLQVAEAITGEIRLDRQAVLRAETQRDLLDAHLMLGQLKTAALVALLDGRASVEVDDWRLARIIVDTSRAVRRKVEVELASARAARELAGADRHARRELHVASTAEARALESAARSVGRVVRRHHQAGEHGTVGGGCTRRCLNQAISGKHRDLCSLTDVVAAAERERWIRTEGDRWWPGEETSK